MWAPGESNFRLMPAMALGRYLLKVALKRNCIELGARILLIYRP